MQHHELSMLCTRLSMASYAVLHGALSVLPTTIQTCSILVPWFSILSAPELGVIIEIIVVGTVRLEVLVVVVVVVLVLVQTEIIVTNI